MIRRILFLAAYGLVLLYVSVVSARDQELVQVLDVSDLAPWQPQLFSGTTDYSVHTLDDREVLRAVSRNGASGMLRRIEVDLERTPFLNWSWRVESSIQGNDESSKRGDDYAARIYVVVSGGLFFWRTRAISYVWASGMPKGSSWPNAYSANSMMLAIESGRERAGQWVSARRNVQDDFKQLHGIKVTQLDAVAIMTDTDDTGQSATAYYGDIFFSDE